MTNCVKRDSYVGTTIPLPGDQEWGGLVDQNVSALRSPEAVAAVAAISRHEPCIVFYGTMLLVYVVLILVFMYIVLWCVKVV